MLTSVPRSDCSAAREAASARLDGELSEHAAAQLDAHLAECTECRMYAASIAELAGTLRFASLEPVTVRLFEPRRRRPHVRVRVAAAAVVLAAATGGSFAIGEMLGSQDSTRRARSEPLWPSRSASSRRWLGRRPTSGRSGCRPHGLSRSE